MSAGRFHVSRLRALQCLCVLLLPLVAAWGWRRWTEPRFEGRGVREWIAQLPYDRGNSNLRLAMEYFGDRAVPYLLEATQRPAKWSRGWPARIPRRYLNRVVDLQECDDIAAAAWRRLDEWTRAEVEANEFSLAPVYPVTEQVAEVLKQEVRAEFSSELLGHLGNLGPKATNLSPELKIIWRQMNPSADGWILLTRLVAESHDADLVPDLVHWATVDRWVNVRLTQTTPLDVKTWAIYALGRNGHVTDEVRNTMRHGLGSTNENLLAVTLLACAQLGVCTAEALAKIEEKKTTVPWELSWGVDCSDLIEPVLRWRLNPNSAKAAEQIRANLSTRSRAVIRNGTAELLGKVGREAKRFEPELASMAREKRKDAAAAVAALRSIDPEGLEKLLRTLPQSPLPKS